MQIAFCIVIWRYTPLSIPISISISFTSPFRFQIDLSRSLVSLLHLAFVSEQIPSNAKQETMSAEQQENRPMRYGDLDDDVRRAGCSGGASDGPALLIETSQDDIMSDDEPGSNNNNTEEGACAEP